VRIRRAPFVAAVVAALEHERRRGELGELPPHGAF
jgi:hypothetical protein